MSGAHLTPAFEADRRRAFCDRSRRGRYPRLCGTSHASRFLRNIHVAHAAFLRGFGDDPDALGRGGRCWTSPNFCSSARTDSSEEGDGEVWDHLWCVGSAANINRSASLAVKMAGIFSSMLGFSMLWRVVCHQSSLQGVAPECAEHPLEVQSGLAPDTDASSATPQIVCRDPVNLDIAEVLRKLADTNAGLRSVSLLRPACSLAVRCSRSNSLTVRLPPGVRCAARRTALLVFSVGTACKDVQSLAASSS